MKINTCAIMTALALALVACEEKPAPSTPKPATPPAPAAPTGAPKTGAGVATPPPVEVTKAPSTGTTAALSAAAIEVRDKAYAAFSSKYDEFKMQIATLQDKAAEVPAVGKAAFDSAMTTLNTLTKDVETKLSELKSATGDTVKKLQDAVDGLWPKIQEQITAAQKMLPPK